jgi:hypothetical protein
MANEPAVRISNSVAFGPGTIGGVVETISPDAVTYASKKLTAGGTREVDIAIDVEKVMVCAIEVDKDATIKTNSATTPDDELALKANQPLIWRQGDPTDLFLTVDVTSIHVVVGVADTVFKIGVGVDATP